MAGTTGLAETLSTGAGSVLALLAAALTAVMTTLNAAQRSEQARGAANAYLALQGGARLLRTVDAPVSSASDARERLAELVERRNAINATAPVPARFAYRLGRRDIVKGRQAYEVDG